MIASKSIQILLAGVAAIAFAGTAVAQGNPPNPAVKSAPVGAGQQSSQQTPMGTTGTPTGGSAAAPAAAAPSTGSAPMTAGSTSSGTSMGSSSTSADTSMSNGTKTKRPVRTARADRN
jgi:hypothetical protein